MAVDYGPIQLPEKSRGDTLAEQWQYDLNNSSDYSTELPDDRLWTGGDQYHANPFDHQITEAFAVGVDRPQTVIYNLAEPLDESDRDRILGTYQWYFDQIKAAVFSDGPDVVIGDHLAPIYDIALGEPRPGYGLFDEEQSKPLLSLNADLFRDVPLPAFERYQNLLDRGITPGEIVLTHELAHSVVRPNSPREEGFATVAGWLIKHFDVRVGPEIRETVTYRLPDSTSTGHHEGPPTIYGATEPSEDWAESTVYYRFATETLDNYRYPAVRQVLADQMVSAGYGAAQPAELKMVPLLEIVYPHWKLFD